MRMATFSDYIDDDLMSYAMSDVRQQADHLLYTSAAS